MSRTEREKPIKKKDPKPEWSPIECPCCEGWGAVPTGEDCDKCDGTGVIE